MLDRLERRATGRMVLVALAAVLGLFAIANVTSTMFADATGSSILDLNGGRNIADRRAGLTPDAMYQLIAGYGPDGRSYHLLNTVLGDVVLPLALFGFGALALLHALRRLGVSQRWRRLAVLLPAAYLVSDLGENAGFVTMLLAFPDRLSSVEANTIALTAARSALIPTMLVAVLAAYGMPRELFVGHRPQG